MISDDAKNVLRELAERQKRGESWFQAMKNDGQGQMTIVYASGGQVTIGPGESVTVLATTIVREDGTPIIRFLPLGWKHAWQA